MAASTTDSAPARVAHPTIMGIENRDYFRNASNSRGGGDWGLDAIPTVCKGLIAANILIFLLQIFTTRSLTSEELEERIRESEQATAVVASPVRRLSEAVAGAGKRLAQSNDPSGQPSPAPARDAHAKAELDEAGIPETGQPVTDRPDSQSPDPERPTRRTRARPQEESEPESQGEHSADDSPDDGAGRWRARLDEYPFSNLRISVAQEWLQLETPKVLRGQIWRLVTCEFCHDRHSVWHIFLNMLFLFWFGPTLERMYGSREFLCFYLGAAIAASLAYVGLDLVTGDSFPSIGASGAVMGVMMLFAIHYPRYIIYVCFVIPVEVRWLVVIYLIYDLHPVLLALSGDRLYTGVAHAAHLGGLAFGFLYWRRRLRLERAWNWFAGVGSRWIGRGRRQGRQPQLRVYRPRETDHRTDLDTEVDTILRKLHQQGETGLTDKERETLRAASERYKNRGPG